MNYFETFCALKAKASEPLSLVQGFEPSTVQMMSFRKSTKCEVDEIQTWWIVSNHGTVKVKLQNPAAIKIFLTSLLENAINENKKMRAWNKMNQFC